jgi:PAS domain S-box-containing protein
MSKELHILNLEDQPADAELAWRELRLEGIPFTAKRVWTEADFHTGLRDPGLALILADYTLPAYDGISALQLARRERPEVPFIFVSGNLGEELAIDALHHGATDYVLKQRLDRLRPAVRRALREAEERQRRQQAEQALLKSEQSYREIFNATHDAIFVHDAVTGEILDVNQPMLDMFGYSRADLSNLAGEAFQGTGHYSHQEAFRHIRLAATEGPQVFEWLSRKKSGELFWSEVALRATSIGGAERVLAGGRGITERKGAEAALRDSEERFRRLFNEATEGVALANPDTGELLDCNQAFLRLTGYERAELIGQPQAMLHPKEPTSGAVSATFAQHCGDRQGATLPAQLVTKSGAIKDVEIKANVLEIGGLKVAQGFFRDVTAELRYNQERETTLKVLHLLNDHNHTCDLIRNLTGFLQDWTGCEAVGVRLQEGDDFPYFETRGFPAEFVRAENHLCLRDDRGQIVRDGSGNPVLDCMCGNILCGRFDPSQPFFTPKGSFWTNCTTELLASTTEADRQARTRNRCNGEGYESVALFALRHGDTIFGLLQVNDRARNRFTPEVISYLEELADQIAMALATRQAQAALRVSERRFRDVTKAAGGCIWEIDARGRFTYLSERVETMLGFHPEELIGRPMLELVDKDERARVGAVWNELSRTQGTVCDFEVGLVGKSDLVIRGSVSAVPVLSPSGEVTGFRGVTLDITGRKRAEEALREGEMQFRAMFEVASIGMAQADPQSGRWLRVNQTMCAITGYSADEMLKMQVSEVTHPEDRQADWEVFQRVVRGELPDYRMEKRYVRKGGLIAWVNVNMTVIRDAAGRPTRTMATIEDITERKRLEAERWAMEAQMRQQQKLESIGTLAGGVAHEINNPINGIMNYAQLIQDRLPADSPLAEYTGEILKETDRVATIVRNLLTFARNENQSQSPARVADIVEATLSLVRTVMRRDQITLTVNVPTGLPELRCRSQQIQQVLMNLMTNARDALNERYPGHDPDKVLSVTASLFEKEGRRCVRVTVEDHGTGITPEVRERMFDPFFTTKPRDQGTGLGLSISHGIVREHHGELTVESEPGKFTRMHLDLPADQEGKQ